MKVVLDVANEGEAAAVLRAWEEPDVRAFVVMIGLLAALPTDRARRRVLDYVADVIDDPERPERTTELPGKRDERLT